MRGPNTTLLPWTTTGFTRTMSLPEPALEENDDVLKDVGPKARILDCSCGIGTFAIALAKLGYEVSGSDGSPGMIEQARLAVKKPMKRPADVLHVGGSTGSLHRSF